MTDQPDERVVGHLKDFAGVALDQLATHSGSALGPMLDRVMRRVEQPGTSISGYNGAGGFTTQSGAVTVELPDEGQGTP